MLQTDPKTERNYCSRLGFALVFMLVWGTVWQFLLAAADGLLYARGLALPEALLYLLAADGHYLVSLPVGFALCRPVPRMPFTPAPVRVGRFVRWWAISFALIWVGAFVGTTLSDLAFRLAGREPVAIVETVFRGLPLGATLLDACVIGPVCEELLCRRLLAGRLARYGEKPAAFVSALLFALCHANLEQFFYAFALGLLLAYAYFRTGRLLVPIALHWLVNWFGMGIPLLLPERDAALLLYGAAGFVMTVAGFVLLVRCRRRQVWLHGVCAPSMRVIFWNAGMTLALIACFVQTAVNFIFI